MTERICKTADYTNALDVLNAVSTLARNGVSFDFYSTTHGNVYMPLKLFKVIFQEYEETKVVEQAPYFDIYELKATREDIQFKALETRYKE